MFQRLRRLEISLAAKCQILFGAAVVLIIAAALAVPWHRMEQLTEQLNQRSAGALAENAILEHLLTQQQAALRRATRNDISEPSSTIDDVTDLTLIGPTTRPALSASSGAEPNTEPSDTQSADSVARATLPRLVSIASDAHRIGLTKFERQALGHFRHKPDSAPLSAYYDANQGYRYVQAVYLNRQCVDCHGGAALLNGRTPAATAPTTTATARFPLAVERSHLVGIVSVDIPSRVKENQLLLNRVFIMAAGLLAGTLAILCFYLITTRLILQPVRVLQETAEKVSQGDLNIRSDISTGDEFQQLSETFNVMLANLKQTTDQLRSINKGLDLKLGQLAESNLALYESNRLKSEFLANVSHELRTPLNSILGFADLLKDALSLGAESKPGRYVNNILQSARHLLELINDLLDLAKIEAGRMDIRSEPLSLPDLFEGLVNILKPLSEQKQLTIQATVPGAVPIMQTDPGKLQQVLYNFLSNAIKFSPPGARIDLLAQREGDDHVRISVSDQGPGIAPEKQQIIFEKFRQVDASVTRTHEGSGLGLAISKELTTLLGGSIGVRSAPNVGATFWVVLPLQIQAGTQDMRGRLVLT